MQIGNATAARGDMQFSRPSSGMKFWNICDRCTQPFEGEFGQLDCHKCLAAQRHAEHVRAVPRVVTSAEVMAAARQAYATGRDTQRGIWRAA